MKGDVFVKKICGLLVYLLLLVFISGCAKKPDTLILQDFWNKKETANKDSMKFVTGLEIIFPKEWQGNIVTDTDTGSDSNTISICEKGNAEAGIGGAVFYLNFFEYSEDMCVIMNSDKVLGIYEQGEKEYVLVMEMPGDRQYSEDDEILINAYTRLSETLDDVIIKTDEMHGFTECGIEDLEWLQYESDWEDNGQSANDSAENQNDVETVFVNRHGDVFNGEGDTAGIMETLKAFEWLVPRSSGECIADNLSAEENEFITESNKVLNGSEKAEDRVWIRIVQNSALPTEGSTIPHKDFIFYVVGEDAYVGIQSPEDNDSWAIWKMPDYGDWLAKEINIYIRMTTGL